MEVVKQLFDEVYVIKNRTRDDNRGTMIVGFDDVTYNSSKNKNASKAVIPDLVRIKGKKYKVT
ncbi:hypothetical protein [Eubacterium sp.]|uniref:hypothetical protein n=1 Tax=Eubacterium sp. TaxID=142586 RepID=UPI0025FA5FD8|nr:hypothetical protein [Eubacterium sp.]MCR5628006.1 hypothetical protein [Eubacterium sp.]